MKKGWQTKTLDQISTNLDSRRVPITKGVRVGGEYPYYGASGIVDYVADYIFDEDTLLISEDGANLLARSTPIAFPASGKYWVNNHAHILKFENLTTQRFVELYLESIPLDEYVTGAAQPKLNQRALNSIPIPVPALTEQQRIVGLLDEAFAGLATAQANAEKNHQNARALFESHLQSVFTQRGKGWVQKRLADVAEFKNGLNFTRQSKGQTLRMVGVGDFQEHSVVPIENLQSVTIDGELDDDYLIRRDDILTVRSNGSRDLVGRCMLVPDVDGMISFSGFIIRIRFDTSEVSARFLLHLMKSSGTRDRLTRDGGGANISNINQAKLSELPISLPSFNQQEDIANRLDVIREEAQRLADLYEGKRAALEALKKSLLHQAFSGEL
jgi:type I restriction enzyme S subunit